MLDIQVGELPNELPWSEVGATAKTVCQGLHQHDLP